MPPLSVAEMLGVFFVVVTSLGVRGMPAAMTSSENSPASVTVQWAVDEERPAGTIIGDLRQSLEQFVDADRLAATTFQTLPRPNQDLEAVEVERESGVVRATNQRLDRETVCPPPPRPGNPQMSHGDESSPAECTIDISIGLVRSLQLEQVRRLFIATVFLFRPIVSNSVKQK